MSRYLILLPAPEAEWADLPPEVHAAGHASHGQFHADLAAGGHEVLMVSPLEPSTQPALQSWSRPLTLPMNAVAGRR